MAGVVGVVGVVEDADSDDGGEYVPEEDEHFQRLTTEDAQDGDPWNGLSGKRGSAEMEGSNVLDQAKAAKRARKALERQKAVEDDWSRMNEGGKPAANILDFSKLQKKQQMACEIRKMASAKHTVVFAAKPL